MREIVDSNVFRIIAEKSTSGIIFFHAKDRKMVWCNEKFKALTRIRNTLKTDAPLSLESFFREEQLHVVGELYGIALEQGYAYDFERPMKRGTHHTFPAELIFTKVVEEGDSQELICLQVADHSMNKLYHELETKRADVDRILSSIEEGLIVIKKDGSIGTVASTAANYLLNIDTPLVGENFLEKIFPYTERAKRVQDRTRIESFLKLAFEATSKEQFETLVQNTDLRIKFPENEKCLNFKTYRLQFTPLLENDQIIEVICLIIDDTRAEELQRQLREVNAELMRLASVDSLTQIPNRRMFDESMIREWRRMGRENLPIAVIMCDVDFFKKYNDHYGHQAGDECLRKVAEGISSCVMRGGDLCARYGGEEFAVILPNTTPEGARSVAERIRERIESLNIPHEKSEAVPHVTLSLGLACITPKLELAPKQLIEAADQALYLSKASGRNRVTLNDQFV